MNRYTVRSRYLGSKKPLGGFYHYINIGSFFLMLLDKYGIKLLIRHAFSINLCGVEDNVENYRTFHFMFCGYGVRVLWNPIFFFSFCHSYLDLSHDSHAQHILFSLRILLLAVEMSDMQAFRSQTRQIAVTDIYI